MASSFVHKLHQLYQFHRELYSKGYLQKDIARLLGLNPSAYSNLLNKILEPMIRRSSSISKHELSALFLEVKNLSEKKTRQQINQYLAVLAEEIDSIENPRSITLISSPVEFVSGGYPVASVHQQAWIQTFSIKSE